MLEDLTDAERTALAQCRHAVLGTERPLRLDCGVDLGPYRMAYQTYGTLNADKSNAILYPTSYAAQHDDIAHMVRSGGALDPSRYFIIIANLFFQTFFQLVEADGARGKADNSPRAIARIMPAALRRARTSAGSARSGSGSRSAGPPWRCCWR